MALIRFLGKYVLKSPFYVKKKRLIKKKALLMTTSKTIIAIFGQNMHIIEK